MPWLTRQSSTKSFLRTRGFSSANIVCIKEGDDDHIGDDKDDYIDNNIGDSKDDIGDNNFDAFGVFWAMSMAMSSSWK